MQELPIPDQPDPNATGAYRPAPTAAERFTPGTLLAGRYRIVAPLGKGGMGEVYRADDLTLAQPVALKFLPSLLTDDPGRLARFRKEVAAARRVSHPNVCRVYDIAEYEGLSFLTMEFVDGEDLSSVLKRMGRMTEEKGVEIARQLCGALAAVHDQGMLHRDLKPANVMLDGRGKVRLTDFGLAAAAEDLSVSDVRSGTPLYQSPEQLAGREVTIRSDLFALGLVLYELFTGRRAFTGSKRDTLPSKPSSHVSGLSPAVEAVILRCLESDPANRPNSAVEVLAGLPGGDPLAAALAAGQTPSPQLVADAGGSGVVPVWTGLLALGAMCLMVGFLAVATDHTGLPQRAGMTEPPGAMTRKARDLLAGLGHSGEPTDAVGRYEPYWEWIAPVRRTDPFWYRKAGDWPGDVVFFYRSSPEPLIQTFSSEITWSNPPPVTPGTANVRLDTRGRLVELQVVPPARPDGSPTAAGTGWAAPLFAAAGLDPARFTPTDPARTPPTTCDAQAAWAGAWGVGSDTPVRVEAGAYRGKPIWFRVELPTTGPEQPTDPNKTIPPWVIFFLLALLGLVGLLAWRNVGRGRGDRVTARRLATVVGVWEVLVWLIAAHHSGTANGEMNGFLLALGRGVFLAVIVGLAYLAVEPFVRRRWPWRLTAWTRLFAGRWRDPMVGRDLLVGMVLGTATASVLVGVNWIGDVGGLPVPGPAMFGGNLGPTWTTPAPTSEALWMLTIAFSAPVLQLFLAFAVFLIVRREWAAWAGYVAVAWVVWWGVDLSNLSPAVAPAAVAISLVYLLVIVFLLARFGLLGASGFALSFIVLQTAPLTADPAAWYFPRAAVAVGCLLGLAGFCCWTATGGKRLFTAGFFGDE
jgi:serine/threonine-protein kinase